MKFGSYLSMIITVCLALFTLTSCEKDDIKKSNSVSSYSHDVASSWMEEMRTLTKVCPGFSPPVASRAFGYAGYALYESLVPGMPKYKSLAASMKDLGALPSAEAGVEYYWPEVANSCLAYMAKNLYANMPSTELAKVVALEDEFRTLHSGKTSATLLSKSTDFGRAIAGAIFNWSKTDGGHEGYKNNFPAINLPTGPGYWVSAPPGTQKPLQPYWGNNRAFVPAGIIASQPPKYKEYSTDITSPFFAQALEVYTTVKNLTQEQRDIAFFWSDDPGAPGTPPGHMISITSQMLKNTDAKLDEAAEMYAKIGMAVTDAFISCWKCKYTFNLLRPVTYIQSEIDPSWLPILATPPFPEYTSGHSVQTAAAMEILSDKYGYNYGFTDKTHANRTDINGSPRHFKSFYEAGQEAALSRLYGGIHYADAINVGIKEGRVIGQGILALPFQ